MVAHEYLGSAQRGSVAFLRGPSGELLLEPIEDGVDRFIGAAEPAPPRVRDTSLRILVALREGRVVADVPVQHDGDAEKPEWFVISLADLLFAVDRGYFGREEIVFAPSIMPLINIKKGS